MSLRLSELKVEGVRQRRALSSTNQTFALKHHDLEQQVQLSRASYQGTIVATIVGKLQALSGS